MTQDRERSLEVEASQGKLLSSIPQPIHWLIAAAMTAAIAYLDATRASLSILYFVPSIYVIATVRGKPAMVLHAAIVLALFLTLPIAAPQRVTLQATFNRALGLCMVICMGMMLRQRRHVERRLKDVNDALESKIAERASELKETVRLLSQSEEQFRLFMRQLPGLAWIKDSQGRYVYANDTTLSFFNLPQERLYGRTDHQLLPAEIATQFVEADRRAIESGSDTATIKCPIDKGSVEQFALVNRFLLPNPKDEAWLVGGVAIDITERKQAEEKVRRIGQFRETIIRTAAEGICVCHATTQEPYLQFSVWNDRMTEITGFSMEEINQLGWHKTMYPDPDLRRRAQERMESMSHGDDLRSEEWEITCKDGQKRTLAISTSLTETESEGIAVVALMQDVTERKQSEEQRRQLDAQMQHTQKLESLGVLAGGIAHDFNNLLTAILGNAALSKSHLPIDSLANPMFGEIEEAAHRAAELTRQLLAYSGKGRLEVSVTRLDDLVRSITALLSTVVSKKAVIELDLSPATFKGDATQVRQVVMNLMINASDALGGAAGTISVHTGTRYAAAEDLSSPFLPGELPEGEYVFVKVEDNGCGMTEELKAKIFDPFFTTKFTGRGLGLAAVLGIVRSHHGTIRVQSAPGQGARFEILFPCCQEAIPSDATTHLSPSPLRGQGTILVIDDEPMVREFARRALEFAGFDVEAAANGDEGIQLFEQQPRKFAAVLLDLTMPSMDGLEVLQEIRRLAAETPVLMMSGYGEQEFRANVEDSRACGFIQKPFKPQQLHTRLSELLSLS